MNCRLWTTDCRHEAASRRFVAQPRQESAFGRNPVNRLLPIVPTLARSARSRFSAHETTEDRRQGQESRAGCAPHDPLPRTRLHAARRARRRGCAAILETFSAT